MNIFLFQFMYCLVPCTADEWFISCLFPSLYTYLFVFRSVRCSPAPPKCLADPSAVDRAVKVLNEARKPLVIIGKGN